jgi:hypothetical protein
MAQGVPHTAGEPTRSTDIRITLRGSVAIVRGVVDRIDDRDLVLQALASLESITGVVDELRPHRAW